MRYLRCEALLLAAAASAGAAAPGLLRYFTHPGSSPRRSAGAGGDVRRK